MQDHATLPRPTFHLGGTVPPQLFINREDESREAKRTLLEGSGNVLVVGTRMIGKTSLVRKLGHELQNESVLAIEVNLIPYDEDPSGFLREVLLLLCYEVGERVFQKRPSELLVSLGSPLKSLKGEYRRFHQLYSVARSISVSRGTKRSVEARLENPAIGGIGIGGQREETVDLGGIHPVEFVQLARELVDICRNAGHKSIVVIADEANRLTLQTSKQILRSYFDVFTSRQIQFVFVADASIIDYRPIEDIFEGTVRLGGFPRVECVHQLLDRYFQTQLSLDYTSVFGPDSVDRIWELSQGHPYLIQLLCNAALENVDSEQSAVVTSDSVAQAWIKLLQQDPRLIRLAE